MKTTITDIPLRKVLGEPPTHAIRRWQTDSEPYPIGSEPPAAPTPSAATETPRKCACGQGPLSAYVGPHHDELSCPMYGPWSEVSAASPETPNGDKLLDLGEGATFLTEEQERARDLNGSLQILGAFTGTAEGKAHHVVRVKRLFAALLSDRARLTERLAEAEHRETVAVAHRDAARRQANEWGDQLADESARATKAESDLARLSGDLEAARKEREALLRAGGMLSNCAYNLAQSADAVPDANNRIALDVSRKAWDAAVADHHAARKRAATRTEGEVGDGK